jgi:hypothetical protein
MYANGMAHFNSDPARALTLLHHSIDLIERIGDEARRFPALAVVAVLEALHGDERRALEALRNQIATLPRYKLHPNADAWTGAQVFNRVQRLDLVARCERDVPRLGPALPRCTTTSDGARLRKQERLSVTSYSINTPPK